MYFSFKVLLGNFLIMLIGYFEWVNGVFDLIWYQSRIIDKQGHEIGSIIVGQGSGSL